MKNDDLGGGLRGSRWLAAMSLGLFLSLSPQMARADARATSPSATEVETTPPAADSQEGASHRELRYARREATTPQAAAFKGQGRAIYIGGSTLAIVLIVVLIVVLL